MGLAPRTAVSMSFVCDEELREKDEQLETRCAE